MHGRFSTAFFAFGFETDAQTLAFLHGGFVGSCRLRNALSSRLVRVTTDKPAKPGPPENAIPALSTAMMAPEANPFSVLVPFGLGLQRLVVTTFIKVEL